MTLRWVDEEALGNAQGLNVAYCKRITRAAPQKPQNLNRILHIAVTGNSAVVKAIEAPNSIILRYHLVRTGGVWKLDWAEQYYNGSYHYNCGQYTHEQPACKGS